MNARPARLIRTRWYYQIDQTHHTLSGFVEFGIDANGLPCARVCHENGAALWTTTGIRRRRNERTARLAFETWASTEQAQAHRTSHAGKHRRGCKP